jgi:hydrogenase nickel incorporation protein HypA/HybF
MHELSIAVSLVEAVCDELPQWGRNVTVRRVVVRVGPLSGVVSSALAFAFDVAAEGTLIAGARLEIEEAAGMELQLAAVEVIDDAEDHRGTP